MMIGFEFLKRGFALALGVCVTASAMAQQMPSAPKATKSTKGSSKAAAAPAASELEPKAVELLRAACDRLAAAKSMSFTAVVTYESPTRIGPALAYTTKSEVVMQRPDKLRVITLGDGPASEFYYDGKSMVAFAPAENLVAVAPAPSTIDATLKAAFDQAAIYFPFSDVLVADPCQTLSDGMNVAFYIGQSKVVGGTTTDMVALVNDYVFVQLWIGAEDKLPRMVRAIYRDDPQHLRHQLELSNWTLDTPVAAEAFASIRASAATSIPFAAPTTKAQSGSKPPPRAKPVAKPTPATAQ
jgi:hypothetical protein